MLCSKLYWNIKDNKIENKLLEIFPSFNIKNDYVLFISSNLYFEFANKLECEIELISKEKVVKKTDSNDLENSDIEYSFHYEKDIRVRKLYQKTNYSTMCKKFGKKSCDFGIPIIFKSFESLNNIEKIILRWNIKDTEIYIGISHNISFSNNSENKMYILESNDYFLNISDNLYYLNKLNDYFIADSMLGESNIIFSKSELDDEDFYQKYQSILGDKFISTLAEGTKNLSIYLEHNTHIDPIKVS